VDDAIFSYRQRLQKTTVVNITKPKDSDFGFKYNDDAFISTTMILILVFSALFIFFFGCGLGACINKVIYKYKKDLFNAQVAPTDQKDFELDDSDKPDVAFG
jgi:hypothetical protein